jgi:hypothetical protein
MPQRVDAGGKQGGGANESSKRSGNRAAPLPTTAHLRYGSSRCTEWQHGQGRTRGGYELAGSHRAVGSDPILGTGGELYWGGGGSLPIPEPARDAHGQARRGGVGCGPLQAPRRRMDRSSFFLTC